MTALIQSVGYCVAAVGPTIMGWIFDATASWTLPCLMLVAVTVLMTIGSQIVAQSATFSPMSQRDSRDILGVNISRG